MLDGKIAMVTGAGQGVGQGIALALAEEGCDIAVLGRTLSKVEATAELLRARGVKAEAVQCDVTDVEAIPAVVEGVVSAFGGLDIQVNNAYSGAYGSLLSMSDRNFQRGFVTGPFATFAFMKAAHPHLKERRGNVINLVSSSTVRWDLSTYGAYAAAKWAIRSLTRAAADEWGRDGIRVNAIAPHALSPGLAGWVDANPEEAQDFARTIPLGYIGNCEEDIGRAVVAIVSPAMRYLTGATVPLDGGQANFD
jgi:NAD(P)-dependent dehydrogenase (short-subunit alcohol dehydrogenase family)